MQLLAIRNEPRSPPRRQSFSEQPRRRNSTGGRRIALVTDLEHSFERELVRGVRHYAASRDWQFRVFQPSHEDPRAILAFGPTGILLHPNPVSSEAALTHGGSPVVSFFGRPPCVSVDNLACGRMQADFFLGRGFRHFVYVGVHDEAFTVDREVGFRHALAAAGLDCLSIRLRGPDDRRRKTRRQVGALVGQLQRLPRPFAVAAVDDVMAVEFMRVCDEAGLRVPEDAAVLGLDNDDLLCEIASPSLSSLSVPFRRIGFEAAALLDRLLDAGVGPEEVILVPPSHVVPRQSTDVVAVPDPMVQRALHLLRELPEQRLTLDDLAGEAKLSARALTRRFRRATGHSPMQEVRRIRLDQAKELLAATDLPVKEVAKRTGWQNARSLGRALHLTTGKTPLAFRQWCRGGGPQP
jgi:LacI family transcriptional regulator